MKYISLDLETTGLDPHKDRVIQIGAVIEDTENIMPLEALPTFEMYLKHERVEESWFAINRNRELIAQAQEHGLPADRVWDLFHTWVDEAFPLGPAPAAGKNVGSFDMQFLPRRVKYLFFHRYIDPGSVFIDWNSEKPPSLTSLLGRNVKRTAVEDARDVIEVLRRSYT